MVGLIIVILLYACKLAFLASSTCVKIIEFSLKNEARKVYLHVHKRIIIDLFSLYVLLPHFRPRDGTLENHCFQILKY